MFTDVTIFDTDRAVIIFINNMRTAKISKASIKMADIIKQKAEGDKVALIVPYVFDNIGIVNTIAGHIRDSFNITSIVWDDSITYLRPDGSFFESMADVSESSLRLSILAFAMRLAYFEGGIQRLMQDGPKIIYASMNESMDVVAIMINTLYDRAMSADISDENRMRKQAFSDIIGKINPN